MVVWYVSPSSPHPTGLHCPPRYLRVSLRPSLRGQVAPLRCRSTYLGRASPPDQAPCSRIATIGPSLMVVQEKGEWDSDWNPLATIAFCPQACISLSNYSSLLPMNAFYGNVTSKVTPMKEWSSFRLEGACILRMASIFLRQGLIPEGVSQQPRKSVSWTAHSHFNGLTAKQAS